MPAAAPLPHTAGRFRQVLGRADVLLMCVAAIVNLNLLPVIAGAGGTALVLWVMVGVLFVVPQTVAVCQLARTYPEEGGLATWARVHCGPLAGFQTAWCYWANNVVYVPSLLLFLVTTLAAGAGAEAFEQRTVLLAVLGGLALLSGMTAVGVGMTRWPTSAGALATLVTVALLVACAAAVADAEAVVRVTTVQLEASSAGVFAILCLSMIGLELGSVFSEEIRQSRSTVPWSMWRAAAISAGCYGAGIAALLLLMDTKDMSSLTGIHQAVTNVAAARGTAWLPAVVTALVGVSVAGAALAWFGAAARMLWTAADQGHLPSWLAVLNRRHGTPVRAVAAQAIACAIVLLLACLGVSTQQLFLTLLDLAVVLQLIPYVTLFAGLARTGLERSQRRPWFAVCGVTGTAVTLVGIAVAFLPPEHAGSAASHVLRMTIGCGLFLGTGAVLYHAQVGRTSSALRWGQRMQTAAGQDLTPSKN